MEPALDVALACLHNPALLPATKVRPLPDGMLSLLRLAAGDEALAKALADERHRSPREIADAAIFFVHQVLFDPDADSYRTLGVRPDAPDAQIKEQYRWLVRWQHPDRAKDFWDGVYVDRVNRAWQDLRTSERRQNYDASRLDGPFAVASPAEVLPDPPVRRGSPRGWNADDDAPMVSGRWARHLPGVVLGGLALTGIGLLALMWNARPREPIAAVAPVARTPLAAEERSARVAEAEAAWIAGTVATAPGSIPAVEPAALAEPDLAAGEDGSAFPAASELLASNAGQALDSTTPPAAAAPPPAAAPAVAATPREAALPAATPAAPAPPAGPAPPSVVAPNVPATVVARPPPAAAAVPAPALATVSVAAPPPSVPAVAAPIDRLAAEGMLHRLSRAYAAGDLSTLMHLFTADASNNRGGRDAISEDYRNLFSTTAERELQLDPAQWAVRADGATLVARYRARVRNDGKIWGDRSSGWIRFELRREDGELKISRMVHERES